MSSARRGDHRAHAVEESEEEPAATDEIRVDVFEHPNALHLSLDLFLPTLGGDDGEVGKHVDGQLVAHLELSGNDGEDAIPSVAIRCPFRRGAKSESQVEQTRFGNDEEGGGGEFGADGGAKEGHYPEKLVEHGCNVTLERRNHARWTGIQRGGIDDGVPQFQRAGDGVKDDFDERSCARWQDGEVYFRDDFAVRELHGTKGDQAVGKFEPEAGDDDVRHARVRHARSAGVVETRYQGPSVEDLAHQRETRSRAHVMMVVEEFWDEGQTQQ